MLLLLTVVIGELIHGLGESNTSNTILLFVFTDSVVDSVSMDKL